MTDSVRFYRDVLGMELLYGGEDARFSSLRAKTHNLRSSIWKGRQSDSLGAADILRHGCGRSLDSFCPEFADL